MSKSYSVKETKGNAVGFSFLPLKATSENVSRQLHSASKDAGRERSPPSYYTGRSTFSKYSIADMGLTYS